MIKISLVALIFCLMCLKGFSADTTVVYKKRNAFTIEAGGKGPDYSLNYERVFRQGKKLIYSWRGGFSLLPHDLSVPVAITAFTSGVKHHLGFSLGVTPYLKDYKTFLRKKDLSDKQFYITPSIGYRYYKANSNVFISAGFDPLIFMDPPSAHFWNFTPEFKPNAHLAVGFRF